MIQQVNLTGSVLKYIHNISLRDTEILQALREETSRLPECTMQISPEQGQFINLITKLIGAKKTLEVGIFTGYSTLCTALALPANGNIVACDCSEEWVALAHRYWKLANVDNKISVQFGDANDTLQKLIEKKDNVESFDFAFIDADKVNYDNYYESALKLVRRGGLIMLDNTLWSGLVADSSVSDPETNALRKINSKLLNDNRVDISMLPFADGITMALKR